MQRGSSVSKKRDVIFCIFHFGHEHWGKEVMPFDAVRRQLPHGGARIVTSMWPPGKFPNPTRKWPNLRRETAQFCCCPPLPKSALHALAVAHSPLLLLLTQRKRRITRITANMCACQRAITQFVLTRRSHLSPPSASLFLCFPVKRILRVTSLLRLSMEAMNQWRTKRPLRSYPWSWTRPW